MKKIKRIWRWINATRLRKLLSLTLAILIFFTSIKFIFIPAPKVSASDIYLGMNEGYGTSINDGNNNTLGAITNAVWKDESLCKVGKCLYFDGTGDLVNFGDDADLDHIAVDNFTIEGWFRTPDITSGTRVLVAKYNSATSTDGGYKIYMDSSGYLIFGIDDDQTSFPEDSASTTTTAFDDNKWHFFSAVKTGTTSITLYVDGKQYQTDSSISSTGTLANTDTFYIGIDGDGSSNGYTGFLDEIKVYSTTARTSAEIKSDLNGETVSRGVTASFGPDQSYISNGLIGYWKMDETSWTNNCSTGTALDTSGNANNATSCPNTTGPTGASTGKFGYSGSFDGTDDYLESTSTSLLLANSVTVSSWVNITSAGTTARKYIVNTTNSNQGYALTQTDTTPTMKFSIGDGSSYVYANGATTLNTGTWYHVVGTADSRGNVKVYVNGVLDGENTATGPMQLPSGINFRIGTRSTDNYFNGKIDETRVYNRALSPAEVKQLYNFAPAPVGYWKFDENTGTTTAYDSSGYGSDATFGEGASETAITYNPWVPGKFGSAARFTGSDTGSVAVVGKPAILTELPQLSISAWVKNSQSALSGNDRIVDHQSSNTAGWNFMMTTQERLRFVVDYDGVTDLNVDSPVITNLQNVWHHVAVTWDGTANSSGVHIYMDGVEATPYANVTSGVGNRVAEGVNSAVGIGRRVNTNQASFNGLIDDVKIYSYPRTTAQIIEDMNGNHPAPGSPIGSSVAKWKMDEGYGTTAHDNSINGNDLTLSTASWTTSGKYGKAFNGLTNVRLSRTDDADLDFAASDDATFSVWFKSDSTTNPSANEYLLEKGGNIATPAIGYAIYTASSGGTICFGIDDDAVSFPEDSVCSTNDLYDNTWHHVVAKKTGTSRLDLYVDGIANGTPDTSISATGTLENASTFYIGDTNGTDGTDEFLGDIDEVQVFRGALTDPQVQSLYNNASNASLGSLSTDSSNNASNSDTDSYCPPGQGSACTGPVAEWKLDENTGTSANDSSGNGLTGTLTNNPTWVTGKIGQAVKFDDAFNQYISVGSSSSLGFTSSFTISTWASTSLAATTQLIVSKDGAGTAGDNRGYYLRFNSSGKINSALYNNSGTACDASPTLVSNTSVTTWAPNTWYHIAMVYNGSDIKLYINGILEDTDATAGTSCVATADNFEIGSFNGGANNLTGLVDNVVVYNYARTPAQIVWDCNHGAPVGWWKLDENTSTTANDSAGNSTAGTLTNTPTWTTGKFNSGVSFAGSNQQILIADDSDFDFADDESMSVTGWFKHSAASVQEIILSKYAAAGYKVIMESDGDITCGLDYDATWTPTDSATSTLATYDDNSWHHFACVKDGATSLSLYIDGILIATDSSITATNTLTNADPLYLGIDADGTSNDYTGSLDDIRIYRYPLTVQQIRTVMNNGAALKYTQ